MSTDAHTRTHGQTQNDFIICPMLYAIAMGQIINYLWTDIAHQSRPDSHVNHGPTPSHSGDSSTWHNWCLVGFVLGDDEQQLLSKQVYTIYNTRITWSMITNVPHLLELANSFTASNQCRFKAVFEYENLWDSNISHVLHQVTGRFVLIRLLCTIMTVQCQLQVNEATIYVPL